MNYDYEITLNLFDKIRICDDIIITVCRLGNKNTHFGCEAPRSVKIIRKEMIEKIIVEEVIVK